MHNALSYYWSVLKRAISDTVAWADFKAALAAVITSAVCLALHFAVLKWRPTLEERLGNPMSNWWLWALYTVAPAILFALVLGLINLVMAPVRISNEQARQIASLTPSNELDVDIHSQVTAAGNDSVQRMGTVITNRSRRNMNLHFSMFIDFIKPNGDPGQLVVPGEWNGNPFKPNTGASFVAVPAESAVEGSLVFPGVDKTILNNGEWGNTFDENSTMQIYDSISGIRVYCDGMGSYPPGKQLITPMMKKEAMKRLDAKLGK